MGYDVVGADGRVDNGMRGYTPAEPPEEGLNMGEVMTCPACAGPHRLPCPEAKREVPLQERGYVPATMDVAMAEYREQAHLRQLADRYGTE